MELRHLATFQMIVREGSFLRAAEKLQYAQSTITLHIQQLETELGVKLFARQGKKVQLTQAGCALHDQADSLLQRAAALQQAMMEITTGAVGRLRIGSIEPTASLRLPSLIAHFCHERPKVRLTVEVGGTSFVSQRPHLLQEPALAHDSRVAEVAAVLEGAEEHQIHPERVRAPLLDVGVGHDDVAARL